MPFKKGESGNPKGNPKGHLLGGKKFSKKVRITAKEILDGLAFEPFKEAVELFKNTKSHRIKADIIIELCNYVAPKLRAVEVTTDAENPFIITLNLAPKAKPASLGQKIAHEVDMIQKKVAQSIQEIPDESDDDGGMLILNE